MAASCPGVTSAPREGISGVGVSVRVGVGGTGVDVDVGKGVGVEPGPVQADTSKKPMARANSGYRSLIMAAFYVTPQRRSKRRQHPGGQGGRWWIKSNND